MYKLDIMGSIVRIADNAYIPADQENPHYQEYLAWCDSGNKPLSPEPPDPKVVAHTALLALEQTTMMGRGMREYLLVSMQDLAIRQAEMTNAELEASGSTSRVSAQDILAANSAWVKLVEINSKATELRAIINKTN